MFTLNKLKIKLVSMLLISLTTVAGFSTPVLIDSVRAAASIQGGNFLTAINNTTQVGNWTDPIDATSQNVVEFRLEVRNSGDQVAEDVQVFATLDQGPANPIKAHATIHPTDFGSSDLNDDATINLPAGINEGFRFRNGHTRFTGVTNIFNCPNTCDISDDVVTSGSGLVVGNIDPGQVVYVTFKGDITGTPAPTPTPTPTTAVTPTPTPTTTITVTPTPTVSLTPTPTPTTPPQGVSCPSGTVQQMQNNVIVCVSQNQNQTQTQTNTQTNNQSQTATTGSSSSSSSSSSNVTVNNPNPQVVTVVKETQVAGVSTTKELPKTGLPLLAWAAAAFIPVGARLKRFNQAAKGIISANFIWEEREFKINS